MAEAASNPATACRGQEVEMVTPGGEVAFVGRMIEDSMHLREQIRWYTSMVRVMLPASGAMRAQLYGTLSAMCARELQV